MSVIVIGSHIITELVNIRIKPIFILQDKEIGNRIVKKAILKVVIISVCVRKSIKSGRWNQFMIDIHGMNSLRFNEDYQIKVSGIGDLGYTMLCGW